MRPLFIKQTIFFVRISKSWKASKSQYWFKSYGILLNGWILPTGGVASVRVCPAAWAAGLFLHRLQYNFHHYFRIIFLIQPMQVMPSDKHVRTYLECLVEWTQTESPNSMADICEVQILSRPNLCSPQTATSAGMLVKWSMREAFLFLADNMCRPRALLVWQSLCL